MLRKLAGQIVDWQIQRQYLRDEERELYVYGYEAMLNQTINILISIAIAIWLKMPIAVVVFLVCYIPLRSYCGGYHERTNLGCTIISALLLLGICLLLKVIPETIDIPLAVSAFVICGVLVFRYAPVEDSNNPLDAEEMLHYRKMSRMVWLLETCVAIPAYLIYRPAGLVIVLSHGVFSVVLCMGMIRNKLIKKQEKI